MEYTEELLKKIKSFGALQYGIDKIISIINPEDAAQLRRDFADTESVVHIMYQSGFNAGQYRMDVENYKQMEAVARREQIELNELEHRIQLRKELFGV